VPSPIIIPIAHFPLLAAGLASTFGIIYGSMIGCAELKVPRGLPPFACMVPKQVKSKASPHPFSAGF